MKKVAFTMYSVSDMPRAQKFYEERLKLARGAVYGDGAWVEYDSPEGRCFAITTMEKGVSPSHTAGGSIAFEVDNLSQWVEELKEQGVAFVMDIFESLVCSIAVIKDTEGKAITLHQLKRKS